MARKHLSNYLAPKLKALNAWHGVFYSFSKEQFNAQRDPNVEQYSTLPDGACVPSNNLAQYKKEREAIIEEAIQEDMADHSLSEIILREACNHETSYTGDYDHLTEILGIYPGITYDLVYQTCIENLK